MASSQDGFKALQDKVQAALVTTVKSTNRLAAEDLAFQRTVDPSVGEALDDRTERILSLSSSLINAAARACGQDKVPTLEDTDDVDMHWRKVVDVVDSVLEKADRAMDEFTGVLKRKDAPAADAAPQTKKPKTATSLAYNMRNANIAKPQLQFQRRVDNYTPWKPVLTKTPHAAVPLDQSLSSSSADAGSVGYKHPYEAAILHARYPDRVYENAPPIPYQPVNTTSATWVDTYEGVLEMLEELKKAKEIAVDLEHHDTRTYAGLLSLMQISTRDKDWVVDTLRPWRHQLEVLNEVFADPSIIKVFHGAYMDIQWLQRDLGLYVNSLFDTFFACEALVYPQRNLAYLLKRFADFDADKKYQMADWRIRPLPEEMFYYARSDTHYLLYIYDMIRNELVKASDRTNPETDRIEHVLQKSKELSLCRYEGTTYNPDNGHGARGWYNLLLKHPMLLSGQQFAVYRALWKWRDDTARKLDESTGYVLPNAVIADIARHMPPDAKALHALIPGNSFLARKNVEEIWAAFQEARAAGVEGKSLYEFFRDDPTANNGASKRGPSRSGGLLRSLELDEEAAESGKLDRSQLFGDVPISSQWEEPQPQPGGQNTKQLREEYVLLPWQRLVKTPTATNGVSTTTSEDVEKADGNVAQQPSTTAKAAPKNLKEEKEASPDREFTLKAGVKSKASQKEEEEEEEDSSSDEEDEDEEEDTSVQKEVSEAEEEIEIEDEEAVAEKERQAKKAAKRERKKAEKKAQKEAAEEEATKTTKTNSKNKSKSKSKKAGEDSSKRSSAATSDDEFANADKAEKKRKKLEKKQLKAAREAKKKAKQNSGEATKQHKEEEEDVQPFDYAKATSVLHTKKEKGGKDNKNGGGSGKKFDPYSKTGEEGPKGARKMPPLHGGRSATFRK